MPKKPTIKLALCEWCGCKFPLNSGREKTCSPSHGSYLGWRTKKEKSNSK